MTDEERIRKEIRCFYDGLMLSETAKLQMQHRQREMCDDMKTGKMTRRWTKTAIMAICLVLAMSIGAVAVATGLRFLNYEGRADGVPLYGTEVPAAGRKLPEEIKEELENRIDRNANGDYIEGEILYDSQEELEEAVGFHVLSPNSELLKAEWIRITGGVTSFFADIDFRYALLDESGVRIGEAHQDMALNEDGAYMSWGAGIAGMYEPSDGWVETSYVTASGIEADIVYNPETGESCARYWHDDCICATTVQLYTQEFLDTFTSDGYPVDMTRNAADPSTVLTYLLEILETVQ